MEGLLGLRSVAEHLTEIVGIDVFYLTLLEEFTLTFDVFWIDLLVSFMML